MTIQNWGLHNLYILVSKYKYVVRMTMLYLCANKKIIQYIFYTINLVDKVLKWFVVVVTQSCVSIRYYVLHVYIWTHLMRDYDQYHGNQQKFIIWYSWFWKP